MALRDELLAYVRDSLLRGAEDIGPDDGLIERGIIDSVGLMQLLGFIEERTGIRIPDHMVTPTNFDTVTAMEEMVDGLRPKS